MYIAIGHFQLKKKSRLFKFLRLSKKINNQALSSTGNLGVQLSGGSIKDFYVISKWNSMEDMKAFTYADSHLEAIKLADELAAKIRLLYFETDNAPSMDEAKNLLDTDERVRCLGAS